VSLAAGGERSFVFYRHPSADMLMKPEDIALDVIDSARIFHFGSITLIDEPSRAATLHAVKHARERGLIISYDPNLRLDLWPDEEAARQGMLAGLEYATILKISDDELDFMTRGGGVPALWYGDMHLIVVTHGSGGATAYVRDGSPISQTGFEVEPIDTTGAGDGFVAGLLAGVLEHQENYISQLPKILQLANAVGALTTTHRGAIPALPLRDQVDTLLSQHLP
ncbi:MAG: PfkB family carbohydrate kinase, partial [Chloroflexota bacterium]